MASRMSGPNIFDEMRDPETGVRTPYAGLDGWLRDQAPVYDGPMGFLDSLERWFRGEADEVRESMDDAAAALNADLDRREAELKATPEEKMGRLLEEIEQSDQQLDEVTAEIRSKSETAREVADAAAETVPVEGDGPEPAI